MVKRSSFSASKVKNRSKAALSTVSTIARFADTLCLFLVQNDDEAWAVGGGGSLWYSTDGGKTFKFSSGATNIGANLYDVKFFGGNKGFAIGSDGVLLK